MTDDLRDRAIEALLRAISVEVPAGLNSVTHLLPWEELREIKAVLAAIEREKRDPPEAR